MYSKGSGVELRENAPESVEEEEEGRRRLGSIVLGSLVIKVVPGSLGSKVLGTSLDLGWLGRLTRDLASLPGGGGAKELAGPSRATNCRWKRRISSPGEEGEGREGREYWHMERDLQKYGILSLSSEEFPTRVCTGSSHLTGAFLHSRARRSSRVEVLLI